MQSDAASKAARAKIALVIGAIMAAIATWSSWDQYTLIQEVARGVKVPDAVLDASDNRQAFIGIAQTLVGIVVAVVFLMWVPAVARRVQELGVTDLKYAPKWAVWGFLVPILNVFRPHQVMSELWRATEIGATADDPWRAKPTPAIVHLWWGALLIDGVIARVLLQNSRAETIDEITRYAAIAVVSDAIGIVTALLAYQLVSQIDARLRASESRAAERVLAAPVATA